MRRDRGRGERLDLFGVADIDLVGGDLRLAS